MAVRGQSVLTSRKFMGNKHKLPVLARGRIDAVYAGNG